MFWGGGVVLGTALGRTILLPGRGCRPVLVLTFGTSAAGCSLPSSPGTALVPLLPKVQEVQTLPKMRCLNSRPDFCPRAERTRRCRESHRRASCLFSPQLDASRAKEPLSCRGPVALEDLTGIEFSRCEHPNSQAPSLSSVGVAVDGWFSVPGVLRAAN